jgi:amino acid transporter
MWLAGPVEFSTGDLLILLVAVALTFLAVPFLAGTIAFIVYRRRTPLEERERRAGIKVFALWTALAFLVQIAVLWLWSLITGAG